MNAIGRAFVAVVPQAPVLDAVEQALGPLRGHEPDLRWTRRPQWHVTLQFLGVVPDADGMATALHEGVAGIAPFAAQLAGAGAFRSPTRASVLWAGVGDGAADLGALAAAVAGATVPLGVEGDDRPFHPHLTLARLPRPRRVDALLARLGDGPFGPLWPVGEVVLVESTTKPSGAEYVERARMPLAGVESG